jgi:DNA repair exonuclease SbcCD nuclease subunit
LKNILIFGDLHINQSSLKECFSILEEISQLVKKYSVDTIISLGDTFDFIDPSSDELDLLSVFIRKTNTNIILLAANSHESTTQKDSIINHFGILNELVTVVKEFKDSNHLYCGHYSIKESSKNYDAKVSQTDLKQYLYVFLGHLHSYEIIKPNIVHLGSCRYVNFDEAKDKQKIVALITNYDTEEEKVHFLKFKNPIPMVQIEFKSNNTNKLQEKDTKNSPKDPVSDIILSKNEQESESTLEPKLKQIASTNPSNLSQIDLLCQQLDKLDPKTKVKVKIKDFEGFKVFLPFESKYKEKFVKFVRENDFELISENNQKYIQSGIELKQAFDKFTEEIKIDDEIKEIILRELK